jgi:DNA-binding transcriptional ArsR family regulator
MSDRASRAATRPRARPAATAKPTAATLVTERDRALLAFVAEHRVVLAGHVQELLGVSQSVAYRRLGALTANGLVEHARVLQGEPGWYQVTRAGLAMIESELPPPRLDLRCYKHDIGVAWLWLAASRGAFGAVQRIVSEREMRSRDGVRQGPHRVRASPGERAPEMGGDDHEPPFGVRLGGVGPGGLTRLHYPDLLLISPREERIAVELELSAKGRRRLETILAGYGAEPRVSAVLYLAEKAAIRREIRASATRLGISHLVHVQPFAWAPAGRAARTPARSRDPAAIAGTAATRSRGPATSAGASVPRLSEPRLSERDALVR